MIRALSASLLLLLLTHPVLAKDYKKSSAAVSAGLGYFSTLPGSGIHDFLYPDIGYQLDTDKHFLDAGSNFPMLIPDLLVSAVRFLGGTDALPPLWGALNGGEENPGRMIIMRGNYRYAFFQNDGHKFDVGGLFDAWWMSPEVEGKHFGNITWNLGPSVGYRYRSGPFVGHLMMEVGNGFSGWGSFNPFYGLQALARVRLGKVFGLYCRLHVRQQNFDYSGFEPNGIEYQPEQFDVRMWETMFTADAGFVFHLRL
jgi:hypothetical protein